MVFYHKYVLLFLSLFRQLISFCLFFSHTKTNCMCVWLILFLCPNARQTQKPLFRVFWENFQHHEQYEYHQWIITKTASSGIKQYLGTNRKPEACSHYPQDLSVKLRKSPKYNKFFSAIIFIPRLSELKSPLIETGGCITQEREARKKKVVSGVETCVQSVIWPRKTYKYKSKRQR